MGPLGVSPFGGPNRAVGADSTVEMTQAEAAPLLRAGWPKVNPGDLPK